MESTLQSQPQLVPIVTDQPRVRQTGQLRLRSMLAMLTARWRPRPRHLMKQPQQRQRLLPLLARFCQSYWLHAHLLVTSTTAMVASSIW